METRSQAKQIRGPQIRPGATSVGRTQLGSENPVTSVDALVNPSSSATGSTRSGKLPFRTLLSEGGPPRSSSPFPRSESAGGACGPPGGGSPRHRGKIAESGDAGERPTPSVGPKIAVDSSGEAIHPTDEEAHDFTLCSEVSGCVNFTSMSEIPTT